MPANDDGSCRHACTAAGADGADDDDHTAPQAVADAIAGRSRDDHRPAAHAGALPRQRAAKLIARSAGDAQLAAAHGRCRTRPRQSLNDKTTAAHGDARARADLSLNNELTAGHAAAHIVQTVAAAGDDDPLVRSADADGEAVAERPAPIALLQGPARDLGLAEPGQPLRRDAVQRQAKWRPTFQHQPDHARSFRR